MNYKLDFLPKNKLERITRPSGRVYVSLEGTEFPSVTTVLSAMSDKSALEAWKDRVGHDKAAKISQQALMRGEDMHNCLEKYLLGEDYRQGIMPINVKAAEKLMPILEQNVTTVYGIEHFMYSKRLWAAGTADLICEFDGEPTIVDFKTSLRPKKPEWITDYIYQSTVYALMTRELYKIPVDQYAVLIYVDDYAPQVFRGSIRKQVKKVLEIFDKYHELMDYRRGESTR